MGKCREVRGGSPYSQVIQSVLVTLAALVLFAAAAAASDKQAESPPGKVQLAGKFVPDELLVKFRAGISESKKESIHRGHGTKKIRDFKPLRLHRLKLKEGVSVEEAMALYQADADVEYAEPNYLVSIDRTPNDPRYNEQAAALGKIAAPAAWDLATGSREIVVAVIDTGIEYTHQDLAANMWVNSGEIPGNGLDDDGNGYVDDVHGINAITGSGNPLDDHNHGTHVAGIIGAVGDNVIGVAGVNWAVTIIACKFLDKTGTGNTADAIECLLYLKGLKERATNPVNLLATNNSWGSEGHSQALKDAIAAQGEILFVAAAGNDTRSNDSSPKYPASYPLPNLVAVAATDFYDKSLASFSNFGKRSVDVAAPGVQVLSTVLNNGFSTMAGTSMATPHVTGLAALIVSSGKDWKQARNLILTGGDTLATLADRILTGRRINAYGSLTCANRPLLTTLDLPSSTTPGVPVTLSVLSVNCDVPLGPVSASVPGGTVQLRDDGVAPDVFANDGIFTGTWIPTAGGAQVLTIASPAGIVSVAAPPLILSDTVTVDPSTAIVGVRTMATVVGSAVQLSFIANGGLAPFTWSIVSGSLPPGLNLSATTGELTGTPTTLGKYSFTIKVTDALGTSDIMDWRLIVNDGLRPGWPKLLATRIGTGFLAKSHSPVFADLDGDGKDELVVVAVNTLYLFNEEGLIAKTNLPGMVSSPAIADLDGDGAKEIIVNAGYPSALSPSIYAFHRNLTRVTGFPAGKIVTSNGGCGVAGTPVVADFDNDGSPSILTACIPNNTNDPNFKKNVLVMVDSRGVMESGWPRVVGTADLFDDKMPAVADLDGDGRREIILSSGDGTIHVLRRDGSEVVRWSAAQNPWKIWTPVPVDLNSDGLLEIAVKSEGTGTGTGTGTPGYVGVFDRSGSPLPGWPRTFKGSGYAGLIAADFDGHGRPELLFPTSIYARAVWQALRADGSSPAGWPVTDLSVNFDAFPVVGDANGDGFQEVLFNLYDAYGDDEAILAAYSPSGQSVPGYPKYIYPGTELRTGPALGDLDGNGRVDVAVKAENGLLYVFEAAQGSSSPRFEWPMYGRDPRHSNARPIDGPADLSDLQVTSVSATVTAGTLAYVVTVKNVGSLPAAATNTALYFAATSDYLIVPLATAPLAAGAELILSGTVPLPTNLPQGLFSVVAVADVGNSVHEGYEENNRTIGNQIELLSDLQVKSIFGKIDQGLFTYTVTVKNAGTMSASASTTALYLAAANDFPMVDLATAPLAAGAELTLTGSVALPPDFPPGTYSVMAAVDAGGTVVEVNENNNRVIGNTASLLNDLSVSYVDGGLKKGLFSYTVTVTNAGTGRPATSVILSLAGAAAGSDIQLTQLAIDSVVAGMPVTLSGVVTVPETTQRGTYTLTAQVDPGNALWETDETNNGAAGGEVIIRHLPRIRP